MKYIIITITIATMAFIVGVMIEPYSGNSVLEQAYKQYNNVRVYEDGSYSGKTIDGKNITGCIKYAPCND